MNEMQKGSIKAIRYMHYLALLNENKNLTEIKVGKLININNLLNVMQSLTAAMAISSPKTDEKTKYPRW